MARIKRITESFDPSSLKVLPMFYSSTFKKILTLINSRISNELLNLLDSESTFKFSYVKDMDLEYVSILPVNRAVRIVGTTEKDFTNPSDDSVLWGEKYRNPMKLGGFVNSVIKANTQEVTDFVNAYRAQVDTANYNIRVVNGEEIRHWYNIKTYYNPTPAVINRDDLQEGEPDPRTTLMKSCLKQPEKQPFFDIYCKNVDQVGMLIMTDQNNKLRARAIVWFDCYVADDMNNPTKGVLLDRIYYTSESDVDIFINYAKEKGWFYKPSQQKEIYTFVMNGQICNRPITTRLKVHGEFPLYPYVDTMCYYTPETGRLSSNRGRSIIKDGKIFYRYQLHNTNGSKKRLATDH